MQPQTTEKLIVQDKPPFSQQIEHIVANLVSLFLVERIQNWLWKKTIVDILKDKFPQIIEQFLNLNGNSNLLFIFTIYSCEIYKIGRAHV